MRVLDPSVPLDPTGADGRSELRGELLRAEYHRQDVLQQILDWVQRRLQGGLDAAHDAPPLSTLAAMLVFLGLVVGLLALLSRARRTATGARTGGAVLADEVVSAAQLRDRARTAYAEDRYADTVVEGFRALTLQQVERGLLVDTPGATAHEVAAALRLDLPGVGPEVAWAADRFDAVRYGRRPATRAEADRVLALDADLARARRGARR